MRFLLISLLWFSLSYCHAQRFPLGLTPPSLKWKQINTEKVQVVYPSVLDSSANRIANLIHFLYDSANASIGDRNEKVTIIIQNQSTISNGFVATAPFRSEFFMTPPQFSFAGPVRFTDLLAIHEYRHVQQFTNSRQGITKLVSKILGQSAWGVVSRLAHPRWYREGDAIVTETALSLAGRGRMPDFSRELRTLALNDRLYNYEKTGAGSFKDFVPDHWHHGYFMVNHVRSKYGQEVWRDALSDGVRYKRVFFPFSRSLKKQTGLGTIKIHNEMFQDLQKEVSDYTNALNLTTSDEVQTKPKKTFTNHINPHYSPNRGLVFEKSGLNEIPTFYILYSSGRERKLTTRGFDGSTNGRLSVSGTKLIWSELGFNERWGNKNYSIIRIFDIDSQEKAKLTSKTKLFSPALSSNGDRVVAIEVDEREHYQAVILDSNTGEILAKLPNPNNLFLTFPVWSDNDQEIIMVGQNGSSNSLLIYSLSTNRVDTLVGFTPNLISFPYFRNSWVFFTGSFGENDEIYAAHAENGDLFQVTTTRSGATHPSVSPDGTRIYYSEFTLLGYEIRTMEIKPETWTKVPVVPTSPRQYDTDILAFEVGNMLNRVPTKDFPTKKFRQTSGLINFHSIVPFVFHPRYGVDLVSQNKLTTMSAVLGYRYNTNENLNQFSALLSYAALFPVVNFEFQGNLDRERLQPRLNATGDTLSIFIREWQEWVFSPGLTIPLNLSHDNYQGSIKFSGNYNFINLDYQAPEDQVLDGDIHAYNFKMEFSHFLRIAKQHIIPRFGQSLDLTYKSTFASPDNEGDFVQIVGAVTFPGFSRNHSLWFLYAFKKEDFSDEYKFEDEFFYARGYPSNFYDRITTIGVNYALPLLYPDLPLGPVAFVQRVKTNFFFDYSRAQFEEFQISDILNRSAGVELTFDFRFFRVLDLNMGVRYSFLIDDENVSSNRNQFEFILLSIGG